jgi:hypothetical protein
VGDRIFRRRPAGLIRRFARIHQRFSVVFAALKSAAYG